MIGLIFDHIWQSTLFLAVAGLLTFLFRTNSAGVRYGIWLSASLKFLIPLAALTASGAALSDLLPSKLPAPPLVTGIGEAAQPFSSGVDTIAHANLVPAPSWNWEPTLVLVWLVGFAFIVILWLRHWLNLQAIVRSATPVAIDAPLQVKSSSSLLEPGLVGIFRPVLLLPTAIAGQLSARELDTVIDHELCHWRRRDNLTAALHMLVEALFWFHPLVWWLETRLISERERACDEAVLAAGRDPELYAESILKVCKFYVQSPLPCVAGLSGASLKKRIEAIMAEHFLSPLSVTKKLALVATAVAVIVVPVTLGLFAAPPAIARVDASGPRSGSKAPLSTTPVREWLSACDANKDVCDNQIEFVELAYTNNPNSTVACVPSTAQDDRSTPVMAWLKAHPDIFELAANKGIGMAIEALYPCKPQRFGLGPKWPPPKTWPALQCLLGMGPKRCEMVFEWPVTITHCAEQYAHERLDNCHTGPLGFVDYLGANATGADVYSVTDRHMNSTFIISIPGPDGKVPQYCYFGRPPASSFQGVCNDGHRVDPSALVVTSLENPMRSLYRQPK
jgi:beta-lactamase regulating signal transducer with metallopeptidase domain